MAPNAPKPTTAEIIGGTYNASPDTLQDGQSDALQLDASGNLKVSVSGGGGGGGNVNITGVNSVPPALTNPLPVELSDGTLAVGTAGNPLSVNVISGGGSNASVGVTGNTAPTSATEIGLIDTTGKLQGVSITTPLPVSIQGASSNDGIFQEMLMELRAMRKTLMLVYEESGEGDLSKDFVDDVITPTNFDY